MKQADTPISDYRLQAYVLVSLALALPVLLWPWLLTTDIPDTALPVVERNWTIAAAVLLMAAVVADGVLDGAFTLRQTIFKALWITIAAMLISYALRSGHGPYLLATGFLVHSMRSMWRIWCADPAWWLWPSWIRDVVMASSLFGWLIYGV